MDMVQCKTTYVRETLKLDIDTDVCVLPVMSLSGMCLMGKVTVSVS